MKKFGLIRRMTLVMRETPCHCTERQGDVWKTEFSTANPGIRMATDYALAMTKKWTATPSARSERNRFFRPKTGSKIFAPCHPYCPVSIANRNPESHFYSQIPNP
jgi:hypothetical protein